MDHGTIESGRLPLIFSAASDARGGSVSELFPALTIEIVASNRYYDIIENGLDLAIRTRRVEADSSITIRRLAETRRLLAASPQYLSQRGTPRHPQELTGHDLILYTLADNWNELKFRKGNEVVVVKTEGAIVANDGQLICEAARGGLGILAQPTYIIQKDLDEGGLCECSMIGTCQGLP